MAKRFMQRQPVRIMWLALIDEAEPVDTWPLGSQVGGASDFLSQWR